MKKLATLCLTLALCLGLCVPALAAEEVPEDLTGAMSTTCTGTTTETIDGKSQTVYLFPSGSVLDTEYGSHSNTFIQYLYDAAGETLYDVSFYFNVPSRQMPLSDGLYRVTFSWQMLSFWDYYIRVGGGSGQTEEPDEPEAPAFTDVPDWCANEVAWAAEQGITGGTTPTTFSPDTTCNTAQILTFLWRAAGEPAASTDPFPETAGQYYADAAAWAHEEGLIESFEAGLPCTRSMVVEFLWKLEGSPAVSGGNTFTDVADDASWSPAGAWVGEKGITGGVGGGRFAPDSTCTRGQIVTFLYRAFAE